MGMGWASPAPQTFLDRAKRRYRKHGGGGWETPNTTLMGARRAWWASTIASKQGALATSRVSIVLGDLLWPFSPCTFALFISMVTYSKMHNDIVFNGYYRVAPQANI